jgi:HlyD family type I secretion membrane fusion protein
MAPPEQARPGPAIPTGMRGPILVGAVCILVILGGLGGWGATAPLASAVIAQGIVAVDSKKKRIQHLEGGIVRAILVRDGDRVKKGQVLLRLEETRVRANLSIVRSAYDAAAAVEARLLAERDGKSTIRFPSELTARARAADVRDIVEGQRALFTARKASLVGQIAILRQRKAQLAEEIAGLRAQQRSMEKQITFIREERDTLLRLFKRGHTTKQRILALRRELARLTGERGKFIADIARAKKSIGQAELEVLQLKQSSRQEVVASLRETQTKLIDLRERITAARVVVDRVELRAPVAGTVVGLKAHTIGGVIKPGETILEIVPARDRLIIEARVAPLDIDEVSVGLPARITFVSFKQRHAPQIDGRIVHVSADSLTDDRTGQSYYAARVEVSEGAFRRFGKADHVQPGMPTEVMIRTGERTAVQYLVQPILDSMRRSWREQ